MAVSVLLIGASSAAAGSLEVGPTTVQMIATERAATFTVRNVGADAASIQVRTVDWTQPDGSDVYSPSKTLLASPPVVKLNPGETQVIRLVVENTPPVTTEMSYRVILDEIPSATAVPGAGVKAAIRVLVPVFITPSTAARPTLRWTASRSGGGLVLTAHNDGRARERLLDLKVTVGGAPLGEPLDGYALSHASRSWILAAAPSSATSVSVSGEGGYGLVKADVPIGP